MTWVSEQTAEAFKRHKKRLGKKAFTKELFERFGTTPGQSKMLDNLVLVRRLISIAVENKQPVLILNLCLSVKKLIPVALEDERAAGRLFTKKDFENEILRPTVVFVSKFITNKFENDNDFAATLVDEITDNLAEKLRTSADN